MRKSAALLLILAFLLTGCAGRQMEEELLVIVLAVDEQDGWTRLAVKAPAAATPDEEQKGYLTLEASGRSLAEAVVLLNASTPRKLNFSQVREIVLGIEACQSAAFPALLRQINALPRIRRAARLIVCNGSACALAAQQKPYMGLRLSRYADDTLADSASKGFTPDTTLAETLRDLGGGLRDPLLILGAVNDFSNASPAQSPVLRADAGNMARKSADPIDLFGAAVTDGAAVTGTLNGEEMALLHLLTGAGHSYTANLTGQPATLYARTAATLTVDLTARPIRLGVQLLCDVRGYPSEPPDLNSLENQIGGEIRTLIQKLQGLDSDALGFGDLAVRRFWTIGAWESLNFKGLYREAAIDIRLSLRLLAP
ncbi:MAG: hypothetical protein IJ662_12935 [Clostridia bacterium]|nr:hypothetical protein [Clostridia bacterium]